MSEPVGTTPARPVALKELPPLPMVSSQLLQLVSRESVSYQELAQLIQTDVAFSAEVLRVANSAIFNLRSAVTSIQQAISVLGLERLKSLVLTLAMQDFVFGARHHDVLQRCWRHNLASALVSELVAGACQIEKSQAYTAGMMHDIGRLALVAAHPNRYASLVRRVEPTVEKLTAGEREEFGIDHCEAGRWLVEDWHLPAELGEVALGHHREINPEDFSLTGLVARACRISDLMGFAVIGEPGAWDPERAEPLLPEAALAKMAPDLAVLPESISGKIELFGLRFLGSGAGARK